jgi:hypothetical protein
MNMSAVSNEGEGYEEEKSISVEGADKMQAVFEKYSA